MSNNTPGMTVEEGNKLIAEFMNHKWFIEECEYCGKNVTQFPFCDGDKEGKKRTHALGGRLISLKYDSDWNWLIDACRKFGRLDNSLNSKGSLKEYGAHCKGIDFYVTLYEIQPAFERLVVAIQWYNTQTPQP